MTKRYVSVWFASLGIDRLRRGEATSVATLPEGEASPLTDGGLPGKPGKRIILGGGSGDTGARFVKP